MEKNRGDGLGSARGRGAGSGRRLRQGRALRRLRRFGQLGRRGRLRRFDRLLGRQWRRDGWKAGELFLVIVKHLPNEIRYDRVELQVERGRQGGPGEGLLLLDVEPPEMEINAAPGRREGARNGEVGLASFGDRKHLGVVRKGIAGRDGFDVPGFHFDGDGIHDQSPEGAGFCARG